MYVKEGVKTVEPVIQRRKIAGNIDRWKVP